MNDRLSFTCSLPFTTSYLWCQQYKAAVSAPRLVYIVNFTGYSALLTKWDYRYFSALSIGLCKYMYVISLLEL